MEFGNPKSFHKLSAIIPILTLDSVEINYKFFNDSKSSSLRRHLKAQFYGGVDSV